MGIEKVDANENSKFRDYLHSKLFYVPTLITVHSGVYLVITTIFLLLSVQSIESEIELITYWGMIALFSYIPLMLCLSVIVKREFTPKIDALRIMKYLATAIAAFGTGYVIQEQFLVFDSSIFVFLPNFLLIVALCVVMYCGITYLSDSKVRKMTLSILNEIRKMSGSR